MVVLGQQVVGGLSEILEKNGMVRVETGRQWGTRTFQEGGTG